MNALENRPWSGSPAAGGKTHPERMWPMHLSPGICGFHVSCKGEWEREGGAIDSNNTAFQ